jgi:ubiquinone/menaquinone biosynthesis C-methylase UbiE
MNKNKVESYYRKDRIVNKYEKKRFSSKGGRFIDISEKRIIIDLLEEDKTKKNILEVGAGTGRFSLLLAKRGNKVTSLDQSEDMLNQIKQKGKEREIEISLVKGDAFKLPFKNNTFDACISIRVLWHFENPEEIIKEMERVTKKDGLIIFDLLNKKSIRRLYTPLANRFVYTKLMDKNEVRSIINPEKIQAARGFFIFPYFFYRFTPNFLVKSLIKMEKYLQKTKFRKYSSVLYYQLKK